MLGLSVQSDDATPSLIAYLRDRRMLLILDTCEHLIEAVAALASQIFIAAPQVHILATSREALRVEGEHVYRLDPLACPPDDPGLTAAVVQTFPATQLFLERAAASGLRLALGAERMDHPVSLTIVLHWAASVFLWTGDLASAEQHIDWFISRAETNSLGPSLAIGHGFKGELAIRLGDAKGGIEIVRKCLEKLQAASYESRWGGDRPWLVPDSGVGQYAPDYHGSAESRLPRQLPHRLAN